MLNIMVINCDDKRVCYEYRTSWDFVKALESDNEDIPMLDDVLCEVEATCHSVSEWWRNSNGLTVNDLLMFLIKLMHYDLS